MKILSFSYCFPNSSNPAWGIFVYQRLAALAKTTELKVCSPVPWFPGLTGKAGHSDKQEWNGLPVYRPRFFYIPRFMKNQDAGFYAKGLRSWLGRLIENWRPDLLDAHFIWPDGVGVALLAREFGIPYVITLRGKIYECLKIENQACQCAEAFKGAAAVISVSTRMAEEAVSLGAAADSLFVIPNGVDLECFRPQDKTACREKLGLPREGRLLVTVAHLGHRKGHHEVLQALAGLPQDIKLVIVGGAAQGGSEETLRAVARKHGVEERLMLTGRRPYEEIPYFYNAADCSVLASYREGCPNAVLESLACGTPVVATDVGAVPDILPTPDAGRIVVPGQVNPLQQALFEVARQSWEAEAVRTAGRVRSWDRVAEEVRGVFKKVLSA